MNGNPASSDWLTSRGEQWRAHLPAMEGMLRPVDEPLIRALRLGAPARIADVACGGGGTAFEILKRAPPGSVVHGFDISPALLQVARDRTRPEGRDIAFAIADVASAPAPVEPYERLASRFGVMFFDDPPLAFSNLVRWLAPGGRFAFAVWGPVADNPWFTSVREVVAEIVDLPSPEPGAPGPFRYAAADELITLLGGAGFRELEVDEWHGALPIGGGLPAAEAATFALASFSSFGELLARAGGAALDEARHALTARLSRHEEGAVVRMGASVHILAGTREH